MFPEELSRAEPSKVEVRRFLEVIAPELIARPALLKLDVQGYELEILRTIDLGMFDYIIAEVSYSTMYCEQPLADDVGLHLATAGFEILAHESPLRVNGVAVQADIVARQRATAS